MGQLPRLNVYSHPPRDEGVAVRAGQHAVQEALGAPQHGAGYAPPLGVHAPRRSGPQVDPI
jgi:hypothetical protein